MPVLFHCGLPDHQPVFVMKGAEVLVAVAALGSVHRSSRTRLVHGNQSICAYVCVCVFALKCLISTDKLVLLLVSKGATNWVFVYMPQDAFILYQEMYPMHSSLMCGVKQQLNQSGW